MKAAIFAINALLAGAMLYLVSIQRISWSEALAGIGLVLTPSAGHTALMGNDEK